MDEQKNNNIIIFPDFEKLKNEISKMHTELSMLLLERDELEFIICKNIEMDYILKLGSLEYKAYEAWCMSLRLKRKIELIQAKINRQEKIILEDIENILDNEFFEYQKILDEKLNKMNEALERKDLDSLSFEETKEAKKLYRSIVKMLHPDVNPNISAEKLKLFEKALQAYKNGDLSTLKIIAQMINLDQNSNEDINSLAKLKEEKNRLDKLLQNLKDSINKIKTTYPYTMREILLDKEKLKQKKDELKNIIKEYNDLIQSYQSKIKEMLR